MKYEAAIYQMTVEGHTFWVAESKSLKGCVGQGETSDEAVKELEQNEEEWLETAKIVGIPIPEQVSKQSFSHNGKIALRLAPNLHSEAAENASELGISLNQYLNNAVIEYNAKIRKFLRTPVKSETIGNVIQFPVNCSATSHYIIAPEREEM